MTIKKDKQTIIMSIVAGLISILLVGSMFIQFRAVEKSEESNIESLRSDELKAQIASYKARYEETMEQYNTNQNTISEYAVSITENKESTDLLDKELSESNTLLGLTDVEGEGVIITLKDTDEATYAADDLLMLVNELKYAGAEAISINDNRIINLTDIISINNSFIVVNSDARVSSPFIVKAIGDKDYLMSTLNLKNSGFVDLMRINNLEIEVEASNNVIIYKYSKEINANIMKEVE